MYRTAIFDMYNTSAAKELFTYMDRLTARAKCMYNVTNFHIRQLMTGLKKDPSFSARLYGKRSHRNQENIQKTKEMFADEQDEKAGDEKAVQADKVRKDDV